MYEASNQTHCRTPRCFPPVRLLRVLDAADGAPVPGAAELVRLVSAVAERQDRQAFAVLFQHFGPRLKTFFMRGRMTAGQAEDLVQEAMLALWGKASYFDPAKAAPSTWIFTIARNLRIDHLRRQRNPADLPPEPVEPPPSAEDGLLEAELSLHVRAALAALSDEQQTIIRLSYYSERSQSEIAEELGIPLGTVKSRTRLAMNRLRDLLEDKT